MPPSPLDDLTDRLGGPTAVAEMTGRALRVVRKPGGGFKYEKRAPDDDEGGANLRERRLFVDGKKHVVTRPRRRDRSLVEKNAQRRPSSRTPRPRA